MLVLDSHQPFSPILPPVKLPGKTRIHMMIVPSVARSFERLNPVESAGADAANPQAANRNSANDGNRNPSNACDPNGRLTVAEQASSSDTETWESVTTREAALGESIEFALVKSGYPLQDVHCRCTESRLELTGYVWRYYYLQKTIEISRRFAEGREIINCVNVVAGPENAEFDDEA
jgi:hypothetical protein